MRRSDAELGAMAIASQAWRLEGLSILSVTAADDLR